MLMSKTHFYNQITIDFDIHSLISMYIHFGMVDIYKYKANGFDGDYSTLEKNGFYLSGDTNEVYIYSCSASLKNGKISSEFKLYFLKNTFLGDGFGAFTGNTRLTTVLKHLPDNVVYRIRLSDDAEQGAMIFENGFIITFYLGDSKKNYYIGSLEGPLYSCDEKLRNFGVAYAESFYKKEYDLNSHFHNCTNSLAFKKLNAKLKNEVSCLHPRPYQGLRRNKLKG